jgi:hypothetical protein
LDGPAFAAGSIIRAMTGRPPVAESEDVHRGCPATVKEHMAAIPIKGIATHS